MAAFECSSGTGLERRFSSFCALDLVLGAWAKFEKAGSSARARRLGLMGEEMAERAKRFLEAATMGMFSFRTMARRELLLGGKTGRERGDRKRLELGGFEGRRED